LIPGFFLHENIYQKILQDIIQAAEQFSDREQRKQENA
jgi:hypothetical protein